MSWNGGSAWGISWLGSWGNSWGPLHSVYEWDTAQGIARNLANNLKYRRVSDIESRLVGSGATTGANVVKTFASAVAKTGTNGANSGAKIPSSFGQVHANAYARTVGGGCLVGASRPVGFGDAAGDSDGYGADSGSRIVVAGGGAVAASVVGMQGISGVQPLVYAYGVRNPSDEEVVILMTQLSRKRLLTRKQYDRLHA